ncbi:hypothetical protein [Bacillus sp. 166amftsu]|uniref:hypothetical protein n=1 Tax=Bacillus sp. 166amftsu TaxID=1761753 RepID=UPI000895FF37|nr:hypothetical protein [Bacillus sp. 166amftsu]SDZ40590.1 hypothetical protein SAMN04488156_12827 [Bacillus sp. 166amftsu]
MNFSVYENKNLNDYQLLFEALLKRNGLFNNFIWNECGLFYKFNRNISRFIFTPYYSNFNESLLELHNINIQEFVCYTIDHVVDKLQELIMEHQSVGLIIGEPSFVEKSGSYWELISIDLEAKEYVLVNHSEKILKYYKEDTLKKMLSTIDSTEQISKYTLFTAQKSSKAYYPKNTSDLLRQVKEYITISDGKYEIKSEEIKECELGINGLKQFILDMADINLEDLAFSIKQFSISRYNFSSFLKGFSQEELSSQFLITSKLWLEAYYIITNYPQPHISLLRSQFNQILEMEAKNVESMKEFLLTFR